MKKLAAFMKPHLLLAVLSPIFILIEVAVDMALPLLSAPLIDNGVFKGDIHYILVNGSWMLLLTLGGWAMGVGSYTLTVMASEKYSATLRRALFSKVQSFSFHNLDKFETGSIVTRLTNDVLQIRNAVGSFLRMLIRAPLNLIVSFIMASIISPRLALIFVVAIPLLALSVFLIMRRAFPLFTEFRRRLDRVNNIMEENLAGVRVVKAFVRRGFEEERFDGANNALTDLNYKSVRIMGLQWPIFGMIMNAALAVIMVVGGNLIIHESMSMGSYLAFTQYIMKIMMALMLMSNALITVASAKPAKDRVLELLDEQPDIADPQVEGEGPQVRRGEIEFRNVTFAYNDGGDPVLKDVSFTVPAGKTAAILGGTGSGKTTLASLIPRLYDVNGGQVLIDGVDVRRYRIRDLRSAVGFSLQQVNLLSRTVRENIAYGRPEATDGEVETAAGDAQAASFVSALEGGYGAELAQRAVNLSGGQKQRLSIARALCMNPKILVFDDSTSAVDVATEARLREALRRRSRGVTTVIVAQRISSVLSADMILVMDDGEIAAQGTHQELLAFSPIYREIYDSQLKGREAATNG